MVDDPKSGRPNVATCLADDARRLQQILRLTWVDARFEAGLLLARACAVDRSWLLAHGDDVVPATGWSRYRTWLQRRLSGEPIAYVLEEREFFGHPFHVNEQVLIPRPDTELLVELALRILSQRQDLDVLDLGTGSGAVAVSIALAYPTARVLATDFSPGALSVAQQNARNLSANNVRFAAGSWWQAVGQEVFDLIVSNPPYIEEHDTHLQQGDLRFEPRTALVAGSGGLDDLCTIIQGAPARIRTDGWLWLEHGYRQGAVVRSLLQQTGFVDVNTHRDLAGQERVSGGRWPASPDKGSADRTGFHVG